MPRRNLNVESAASFGAEGAVGAESDDSLPKLFTVAEAAARLRISKSSLYAIIESGGIDVYRLGQGRGAIRIAEHALLRFLEIRHVAAEPKQECRSAPTRHTLRHLQI